MLSVFVFLAFMALSASSCNSLILSALRFVSKNSFGGEGLVSSSCCLSCVPLPRIHLVGPYRTLLAIFSCCLPCVLLPRIHLVRQKEGCSFSGVPSWPYRPFLAIISFCPPCILLRSPWVCPTCLTSLICPLFG